MTMDKAGSAILTYMDKVIWTWNGGMDNRTKVKPTSDSAYRIASISKVFSWLLGLVAEGQGLINMDEPVKKSVPELKLIDRFHDESSGLSNSYTWNHLASHMAGMPRECPCEFGKCAVTTDEVLQRLQKTHLILPPATLPAYSNLGFSLMGHLLADRVFGKAQSLATPLTYEELVHQLILTPLGMTRTGFTAPSYLVPPISDVPLSEMGWDNPAGGMYSTPNDMAKLVNFINRASSAHLLYNNPWFQNTQSPFAPLQSGLNELGFANYRIRDTFYPRYRNADFTGFGTPWEFTNGYALNYIRNKAGNLDGYSSDIALIPEISLGLTVMTNLPTDGNDWATVNLNRFLPGFYDILHPIQKLPPSPPNATHYIGLYSDNTIILQDLAGILKIVEIKGKPAGIPLVANTWDPSDPTVLQVYIPENAFPCMTGEFMALGYAVLRFDIDRQSGKVLGFTIEGRGLLDHFTKLT